MNEQNKEEIPKPIELEEKLSRKILRPVFAQFQSLSEALLELVDNAFDEFDGFHGGNHLEVDIWITKNSITIVNSGGKGMGPVELQTWLEWGDTHKTNVIGEYGQGGKAAMGYLGNSWVVQCKRWDEQWLWEIRENDWSDTSVDHKKYKAVPTKFNDKPNTGYCNFQIRKLKKHRLDMKRIKETLANTYRKLLEDGKATITINSEPISPLLLPLYDGYEIQSFKQKAPNHMLLEGWIGRLKRDARVKDSAKIVGGMRLLRKGRLIKEGEYFGHRDFRYKASLGTLIGEVELPKVTVLPNKTGFDTDSSDWEEVRKSMYKILKPHIDDLLSEREEDIVSREEKKRVSAARLIMIEALKLLNVSETGRKQPEKREDLPALEPDIKTITSEKEEHEKTRKKPEPLTPPPEGAIGKLKRLGKMPDWDIKPLDPTIRSDWTIKDDGHRCLVINKKYSLYEQRNGDELYLTETAALRLAEPEGEQDIAINNYIEEVDRIMRAVCEIIKPSSK